MSFDDMHTLADALDWALLRIRTARLGEGDYYDRAAQILSAALAAPASQQPLLWQYLIRARWPDGVEAYLDVRGVYDLGGGKVGIDVSAPDGHPLANDPEARAVLSASPPLTYPPRAQRMREAGYTRRPTLRELSGDADASPPQLEPLSDERLDESFEAGNEAKDIAIPAHLAAALSLSLDEFDASPEGKQP